MTSNPQDQQASDPPPLIVVVSDGVLLEEHGERIAGRTAIHVPISGPELPLPAMATTVATGVHLMSHGIVTMAEIDEDSLELRPVEAGDRLFPAFWTQGIRTTLIGWPASVNDDDVQVGISPAQVQQQLEDSGELMQWSLEQLHAVGSDEILQPKTITQLQLQLATLHIAQKELKSNTDSEVFGLALKCPEAKDVPPEFLAVIQKEIVEFIQNAPPDSIVVLVQGNAPALSNLEAESSRYTASYLIPNATHVTRLAPVEFPAIGGSMYLLTRRPCPQGVTQPTWKFLSSCSDSMRPFPLEPKNDTRNWDRITARLLDCKEEDTQGSRRTINLLVRRFIVMSNIAYWYSRWGRLEEYSTYLISLRGATRDYWLKILSLQKQGKTDEIKTTVGLLNERYPDIPVTILANCLTLLDGDAGKVKSMLEGLKPSDFKITTALGMYGVLSIRAELYEQGTEALEMTIQLGVDSPAERSLLAGVYYSQEEFVKALHAIGRVGHVQGKLSARLLRLRILVALQKTEEAERLASSILLQEPANQDVQHIMKRT